MDDLSFAISLLRDASRRGEITIRRCKDRFGKPFENGYRDLQLNVELEGFVGELQLNLRRIIEVKAKAHTIYEVERVIEAKEDKDALQRAVEGPGLESEQVLRLRIEGGRSVIVGSLAVFEAVLARALPPGCVVANVYSVERGEARAARSRRGRCHGPAAGRRPPNRSSAEPTMLWLLSSLHAAAKAGQVDVLARLLDEGADVDQTLPKAT